MPFGGSISTQTVNSFFFSFFQNLLSGSRCKTGAGLSTATAEPAREFAFAAKFTTLWGWIDFTASAMARICAGVVPQQAPRIRTPRAAASRAKSAKYSGEDFG